MSQRVLECNDGVMCVTQNSLGEGGGEGGGMRDSHDHRLLEASCLYNIL